MATYSLLLRHIFLRCQTENLPRRCIHWQTFVNFVLTSILYVFFLFVVKYIPSKWSRSVLERNIVYIRIAYFLIRCLLKLLRIHGNNFCPCNKDAVLALADARWQIMKPNFQQSLTVLPNIAFVLSVIRMTPDHVSSGLFDTLQYPGARNTGVFASIWVSWHNKWL